MNISANYGTQNELLLSKLLNFYKTEIDGVYNPDNNLDKMIQIISGESKISLRIVDWFVTNYAKKYYVVYEINNSSSKPSNSARRFKVYDDYKLRLKAYSKKRFDPFCRWERISIPYKETQSIETTIGQLNFFNWALNNNVIDYVTEHYQEIEQDMNNRNSNSRKKEIITIGNKTRKKREELSISATKSIKKETVKILVNFD